MIRRIRQKPQRKYFTSRELKKYIPLFKNGYILGDDIQIPDYEQTLFALDGTIISDGTNYFLKDITVNSRNFKITGYDWSDRNIAGFPYKSAATISAPAGDAALIAADINNYLYDSGGTPNQIPVVSLFQDVDYEHKIFCKHSGQVLDTITGLELSEPFVKEIVMYSTVRTGADLLACQVYFVVPTEDATAIWVAKNGNDTTGTGTKAAPFLTLQKGDETMAANGTLYAKTGSYLENDTNSWRPTKAGTYKSLGNVEVKGNASYVFIPAVTGTAYFYNFIFNGESNKLIQRSLGGTLNVINCLYKNGSGTYHVDNSSTLTNNFKNCIFTGTTGTALLNKPAGTIDTCFFKYSNGTYNIYLSGGTAIQYTVKHTLFDGAGGRSILYSTGYVLNIFNSLYKSVGVGWIDVQRSSSAAENLSITYCQFANYTTGISINTKVLGGELTFENNWGTISSSQGNFFLSVSDTKNSIKNNNISFLKTGSGSPMRVLSSGTSFETTIKNNRLKVKTNAGYSIIVGSETTHSGDNKITGIIEDNVIQSDLLTSNGCHNIFVGFEKDVIVRRNKVVNGGLGIILKADGEVNSTALVQANLTDNCTQGIRLKGIQGVKIYGNTIKADGNLATGYGIQIDRNINLSSADIKNNVIDFRALAGAALYADDSQIILDNNQIYSTLADVAQINSVGYTYAELVAAGYNENGVNAEPNLNTNLIPAVALTGGADLGEDYDTGLDTSTDWGSDSELPNVVTKGQGAGWQIGAYIL